MGYPTAIVAAGIAMHMSPRILKAYDHFVTCVPSNNGIIAGCTQSTYWARMFLYAVIQTATYAYPQTIRTFIDDVSQKAYGHSPDEVVGTLVPAAVELAQGLQALGCKISDKSVIVARTKATRVTIQRRLRRQGLRLTTAARAKDLGVGMAGGSRRCTNYLRARIVKAKGRITRIKTLQRANKKACRMHNTGAWPQATYGKEAMGLAPGTVRSLRAMAAATVSGNAAGKCATTLIWLALGPDNDPAVRAAVDQVRMWFYLVAQHGMMYQISAEHGGRPKPGTTGQTTHGVLLLALWQQPWLPW